MILFFIVSATPSAATTSTPSASTTAATTAWPFALDGSGPPHLVQQRRGRIRWSRKRKIETIQFYEAFCEKHFCDAFNAEKVNWRDSICCTIVFLLKNLLLFWNNFMMIIVLIFGDYGLKSFCFYVYLFDILIHFSFRYSCHSFTNIK
jgi:hypothetical protein